MNNLISWLKTAWQVMSYSHRRIIWNSILAFIPLFLSIWLFRKARERSVVWWIVFLVFIAFLPNAPYVLTDIVHVIDFTRQGYSVWIITLVVIPQYLIFILAGFEAYVISLINMGHYLKKNGRGKYIIWVELITHALCAVGIYLGRFKRFNSWDFVANPEYLARSLLNLVDKKPFLVMVITFVILTVLYWLMKQITLSIGFRISYKKRLQQKKRR